MEHKLPADWSSRRLRRYRSPRTSLADLDINAGFPGSGNAGRPYAASIRSHDCDEHVGRLSECQLPLATDVDQ